MPLKSNFDYNIETLENIEIVLSSDRLATYVNLARGNRKAALFLYKKNILLSHRFYTIVHILEVCLRNKIDRCLIQRFGNMWYQNKKLLNEFHRKMMQTITHERHGNVIASLPFGFWTSFFGRDCEELWRQEIRFIFRQNKSLRRGYIAAQLKMIRNLRNRIAHHECILKLDTKALEKDCLAFISLLSPDVLKWLKFELLR